MQYKRHLKKGGLYFFTIVTYKRKTLFHHIENVELLKDAFKHVIKRHPFQMDAYVFLPDHFHFIMKLPENDDDFSTRIRLIKGYFSRNCNQQYKQDTSVSRKKKQEQAIWQRRFWEHLISDESDYEKHFDYIHYNPVKHGLVKAPCQWPNSSFQRNVKNGIYNKLWASSEKMYFDEAIGME